MKRILSSYILLLLNRSLFSLLCLLTCSPSLFAAAEFSASPLIPLRKSSERGLGYHLRIKTLFDTLHEPQDPAKMLAYVNELLGKGMIDPYLVSPRYGCTIFHCALTLALDHSHISFYSEILNSLLAYEKSKLSDLLDYHETCIRILPELYQSSPLPLSFDIKDHTGKTMNDYIRMKGAHDQPDELEAHSFEELSFDELFLPDIKPHENAHVKKIEQTLLTHQQECALIIQKHNETKRAN